MDLAKWAVLNGREQADGTVAGRVGEAPRPELPSALRRNRAAVRVAGGTAAGLLATVAMTASYAIERTLRHTGGGPLDYDDSMVPSHAAMVVLGIRNLDEHRQRQLGWVVHWGYGSLMGCGRELLGEHLRPRVATVTYWAMLMVMAGVLFPVLGDTPPPWRWKPDVLATSAAQHAVYAVVAGAVCDQLKSA